MTSSSHFAFRKIQRNPPLFDQKIGVPEGVRNSTGRGYLRTTEGNSIENLEKYRGSGVRSCRDLNGGPPVRQKSENEDEDNCIQILAS